MKESAFSTQYMSYSCIVSMEMESVTKITNLGLKMMVKSGLEKFILISLQAGRWLFLLQNFGFWALL